MLGKLQISTSRKVGLAGIFLIALIDVIFDITRAVYTVDGGAVALDTIWDILEPTIAVIVSSLPTYKALLKPTKKVRNTSYQKFGVSESAPWDRARSHHLDTSDDIELSTKSGEDSRHFWTNDSLGLTRDAVSPKNVV